MTDQRPDNRLVRIATLWERTSSKGRRYFSGFMGDCQLLLFEAGDITRPSGEVVKTWKLLVQEKDPDRRPQQKHEQPTRTWDASRDHDLPTGRTVEHRNPREDPRQQRIDELARRFDERGPDRDPGF
jgi:hypothetical protein